MEKRIPLARKAWTRIILLSAAISSMALFAGCGTGDGISMTGGSAADQAAILDVIESDAFFIDSVTETDEDEDGAVGAQAQAYDGQVSLQSLSSESGVAELPRFWWRGDLERLRRVELRLRLG